MMHEEKLKEDCKHSQPVVKYNQDDKSKCFNSNICVESDNPCCKKLKSRIGELELEISNLKRCIDSLNSQLHEAHEKAEDVSFIKNESVITLSDKLDAVTSMLEEKGTQNVGTVVCKDNLTESAFVPTEIPTEACVKVKNELMAAECKIYEIRNSFTDIKLSNGLREGIIKDIKKERECFD